MQGKQERLKLAMLKISKMTGIPYTNDLQVFTKQMHEIGLITDEEMNYIKRIGLQL